MVDSFYRRQTLWDESMARGVADYMRQNPEHQMMVVAGGWHVRYGFGIPRRVHRRLPIPYVLVGEQHLEIPSEKEGQLMDVTMPSFPMRAVDYLVYQEYEVFRAKGVKLGVMLDDSEDEAGIGIAGVAPGSAAERAGIEKGDRILSFDGTTLVDSFDLIYATRSKRAGDSVTIELLRGELRQTLEVKFTPQPGKHP
jgi:membrane-associated protease RseP (regulator of RpoE activity)